MTGFNEDPREVDRELAGPYTFGEAVRQFGYTLFPINYTTEESSVEELLQQQVLEARATRYLALTGLFVLPIMCMIATVIGVLLTT